MKKLNNIISRPGISIAMLTLLLICFACFIAVYFQVFTGKDLWYEMFAAVLGVIITAVVTMVLLRGQSENDIKREKEAKVFEEKLRIYQEYLHVLYEAIKDHKLSDEKIIRLQFQTSYIAMHTSITHINTISEKVQTIIQNVCFKENRSSKPEILLENLFDIVHCFQEELYSKQNQEDKRDKKELSKILENFNEAFDEKNVDESADIENEPQQMTINLNIPSVIPVTLTSSEKIESEKQASDIKNNTFWENAKKRWNSSGWDVVDKNPDGSFYMKNKNGNPGVIHIIYSPDGYHIGASYQNDIYFSKCLKERKKGRRSQSTWWNYLAEPYVHLQNGELSKLLETDTSFQQYVVKVIDDLIDALTTHHDTLKLKEEIVRGSEYTNCNIFAWGKILACEFNATEDIPYLDIVKEKDNQFTVHLSNRLTDRDKLKKMLEKISAKDKKIEDDVFVIWEHYSIEDIKELITKIYQFINKPKI